MNENVKVVFGLIGGLALFLYGMNSMSDALQKAAGDKMKKVMGFLTKNLIMGALAGILDNIDRIAENCASIAEEALDNTAFVEISEDAKKVEIEASDNVVLA